VGTVEFRQTVNGLGQQFGAGVRLIPGLINLGIAQPIVCRQIDDPTTSLQKIRNHRHCLLMGQGGKDNLGALGNGGDIKLFANQITKSPQAGKSTADGLALILARGHRNNIRLGVMHQQTQQLNAGITTGTNNRNLKHNKLRQKN